MSGLPKSARIALKRVFVAALGCLALAAQLGATVHLAVVHHVVCAEHGELVELEQAHDAVTASRDARPLFSDRREIAHGHDHCVLGMMRRELSVHAHVPELGVATATAGRASCLIAFDAPARAIALLDLAPKSSPPV